MRQWKWFLLAVVFLAGFAWWQLYRPVCCRSESVVFEISKGESFREIINDLKARKLVRNIAFTTWYARLQGIDYKLRAGRFRISEDLSPAQILAFLASPENGEISVTIPEGYSVFEIDKKLTSLGLIHAGEFLAWARLIDVQGGPSNTFLLPKEPALKATEGALFPDTYFVFSKNFQPNELGEKMLRNFEKKALEDFSEDFKKSARSYVEIITMASILEKEVRTKEDYPIVAGILWKRLDHNWPLQTDATLLYGKKDRKLTSKDLREDGSYNTYTRHSLPPTPIGNPGIETIKAALNPINSPYWFYLTAPDGKVIYAKTNEEHNENKRKFL